MPCHTLPMYLAGTEPEHKINNGEKKNRRSFVEIALEKSQLATGEPPIHYGAIPNEAIPEYSVADGSSTVSHRSER